VKIADIRGLEITSASDLSTIVVFVHDGIFGGKPFLDHHLDAWVGLITNGTIFTVAGCIRGVIPAEANRCIVDIPGWFDEL
jgi:hypothetical protein